MDEENFKSLTHISPHLSNENLSKALTDWFKKEVKFTHWEYVGDTGKGDSYLSEVIRIKIHGIDESNDTHYVQVVLKSIPKSVSRQLTFRSSDFFKTEIDFYTKVLPVLLDFQSTKKLSDPFDNYTKLFMSHTDGVNDFLCLEDVNVYNFGSAACRQKGIDMEHCRLILKTFAKYHAISIAMRDQCPEKFDYIRKIPVEQYYHERLWGWYEELWKLLCAAAIDAVEKEYPDSIYERKVKEFAVPGCYKKMIKCVSDTCETGVISHGDSWTNNFLFKYQKNNGPVDTKMIDFQLARCASPVLDISFFVYACTDQELRTKHYDDMMEYYYGVLSKQVKEMGTDPEVYSWDMFLSELKKYSCFGLAFSFESTPFIVLDPEDAFNMEMKGDKKLNVAEVWPVKPFKTKEGRLREANNVVHCVDRGYI